MSEVEKVWATHCLNPNPGMVTAPSSATINPGDWVFYHPRQSDALFQFERIMQVRGGRLETTTMAAYPGATDSASLSDPKRT